MARGLSAPAFIWSFTEDHLMKINGVFGPIYNVNSAALDRWRFRARDGLKALTADEIRQYGEAVEAALRTKWRAPVHVAGHACPCASGTWHTDGREIHAAIRQQQRAALLAFPSKVRRERATSVWWQMYEQAMAEKKKRAKLAKNEGVVWATNF